MNWYKIKGIECHHGAGRGVEKTVYIKEENLIKALRRYSRIPGFKPMNTCAGRNHSKGYQTKSSFVPDIRLASDKELEQLEEIVDKNQKVYIP